MPGPKCQYLVVEGTLGHLDRFLLSSVLCVGCPPFLGRWAGEPGVLGALDTLNKKDTFSVLRWGCLF